jgi:hypothetical protein
MPYPRPRLSATLNLKRRPDLTVRTAFLLKLSGRGSATGIKAYPQD